MQRGLVEISVMKRRRSHNRNSEYLAQNREAAKPARFDFWIWDLMVLVCFEFRYSDLEFCFAPASES